MPAPNNGTDVLVRGVTTLHFSVRRDDRVPLNFTHTHHVAFLETADYSAHVWALNTGLAYGDDAAGGVRRQHALRLESGGDGQTRELVWQTEFRRGVWHNFAVQVDFDRK